MTFRQKEGFTIEIIRTCAPSILCEIVFLFQQLRLRRSFHDLLVFTFLLELQETEISSGLKGVAIRRQISKNAYRQSRKKQRHHNIAQKRMYM
jgi:hypothetical protein